MIEFIWNKKKNSASATKIIFLKEKNASIENLTGFCSDSEREKLTTAIKNRNLQKENGKILKLDDGKQKFIIQVVKDKPTSLDAQITGAQTADQIKQDKTAAIFLPEGWEKFGADIALGIELELYSFDKYKTTKKDEEFNQLEQVILWPQKGEINKKQMDEMSALVNGVRYGRDLSNEPGNKLTPTIMAEDIKRLSYLGLEIKIISSDDLEKEGFSLLKAVGKGSSNPPCAVIIKWKGNPHSKDWELALVGKGITFDAGGINLKSENNLLGMKRDMTGAAVAASTLKVLALKKTKINAAAVLILAENMPDGNAYKPEDIITTASGLTVEVLNTDAEGRLGLADGLWYASTKLKAKKIIDIATLTGAIVMALGHEYAGLFCEDEKMAQALLEAGKASGEKLWQMPMDEEFSKLLKSDIADTKNIAGRSNGAGSSTAAMFLKKFVKGKCSWAHLDIAGRDENIKPRPLEPKGGTAFGIRLLNRYITEIK